MGKNLGYPFVLGVYSWVSSDGKHSFAREKNIISIKERISNKQTFKKLAKKKFNISEGEELLPVSGVKLKTKV